MEIITHQSLTTILSQFPKNENIKCATKLNEKSSEAARSIITTLEETFPNVLDAQIVDSNVDTMQQNALTLQKDLLAIQTSTKALATDFTQIAPKLQNVKSDGSRTTLGAFKAKLKFSRHKAQETRQTGHLTDSSETLNEDKQEYGRLEKSSYRDEVDGSSLENTLVNLGKFWNSVSVDIDQLIYWTDYRLINGVNLNVPEVYDRSIQFPREKSESLLGPLRQYVEIS